MEHESREPQKRRFEESDIPQEVRGYFESLDADGAFWTRENLEKMKSRDATFTTQLWTGLLGMIDQIIAIADDEMRQKFVAAKGIVEETFGRMSDDVEAALLVREYLKKAGVREGNMTPSEILKRAYIDEAQGLLSQGFDPDRRRPYSYDISRRGVAPDISQEPEFDLFKDIDEEMEYLNGLSAGGGSASGGKGEAGNAEILSQLDSFELADPATASGEYRVPPDAAAREKHASQRAEDERLKQEGGKFLDDLIEEIAKDSPGGAFLTEEFKLKPGEEPPEGRKMKGKK